MAVMVVMLGPFVKMQPSPAGASFRKHQTPTMFFGLFFSFAVNFLLQIRDIDQTLKVCKYKHLSSLVTNPVWSAQMNRLKCIQTLIFNFQVRL